MKWRFLSLMILAVIAGVGVCLAFWRDYSDEPEPPFIMNQTEFGLGFAVGEHEIAIPITNPARISRRIIGFEDG